MNTPTDSKTVKSYCNRLAMEQGFDPGGHGGHFEDAVIIEMPLPWKYNLMQQEGALPPKAIELLELWLARYKAGEGYPHRPLVIAPDDDYSQDGYRRVMFYRRPDGAISTFEKAEYHIPEDKLGALVWALHENRDALPQYADYRVPEGNAIRDLLVCTHGSVDVACAKFGYPLYKYLRDNHTNEKQRVWRVSHFGGHIFAPTMMDMPTGHYWAYVEDAQAEQIATRAGGVTALRGHYRGWAGLERGFLQAAERELWQRHGWSWLDVPKSGVVVAQDDENETPQWAQVEITSHWPGDNVQRDTLRVTVESHVATPHSTTADQSTQYPQYTVEAR